MYTVREVASIVEESEHTIRYYARIGLFPRVKRDRYNNRIFSDEDIEDVKMVVLLADTGMSMEQIKEYVELAQKPDSQPALKEMLEAHRNKARGTLIKLRNDVETLEWIIYRMDEQIKEKGK